MRSSTLLEARAVVGALLWILDTLDGHASLAPALSAYIAQHYPPDAPYDYRFVLDMAASWLGANRFEDVVEAERWQGLRTALHLLDAAAWFALNGGLKQTDAGLARSNPFLRFGYAVQELDVAYRSGADRPALELLSDFDEQERGRSLGFVPIGVALATAIHELEQVQERIVSKIWQRAVAEHFRHVLGLLVRSLHHRIETGYVSPFAAPPDGNVIPWLGGKHQFLDALYEPHRWVTDWFSFRNRAIFTPGGIWTRDRLREQFGLAEMVIPCDCGFLISAAVPRWRETHQVQCQCGRVHNLGADDLTYIAVPEDMEA